mgnify:CR=1 FL=1
MRSLGLIVLTNLHRRWWEEIYVLWKFSRYLCNELTDDGLSVKRDAANNPVLKKKVCGNAYEGVNIYKKNGFYYLLASIGSCCAGENSTYELVWDVLKIF